MTEFDLSIYFPIPLLDTEGYVSLANTMVEVAPEAPPVHVQAAMTVLVDVLGEVETGLVSRIDEDLSTRLERFFDIFVDGVWMDLRHRLEFYAYYKHEGTAKFTEDDRAKLDFDQRLDQARVASNILDRLFADGTDFLRQRYPQQATHMAARLDWIESKQLEDDLSELVTPEFVALLKVCQTRYEAMVKERSSRDGKSIADLQVLRNKLRVQLYAYSGVVASMYVPNNPETAKVVAAALRPILVVRAQTRRGPSGGPIKEAVGEGTDEAEELNEAELEGDGLDEG